ncbi:MAG: hypothetical protein P8100_14360 [bacterium]
MVVGAYDVSWFVEEGAGGEQRIQFFSRRQQRTLDATGILNAIRDLTGTFLPFYLQGFIGFF